jgi:hypothetical protein
MNMTQGPAAPASGTQADLPTFDQLAADPEIAPLLAFQPVVRKVKRPDGWTPQLQRELIARIAATGTVQSAVWQMGKHATGAEALYKTPGATSFRTCWDAAIIIGRRRNGLDSQPPFTGEVPGINRRGKMLASTALTGQPGQVMNELGHGRTRIRSTAAPRPPATASPRSCSTRAGSTSPKSATARPSARRSRY